MLCVSGNFPQPHSQVFPGSSFRLLAVHTSMQAIGNLSQGRPGTKAAAKMTHSFTLWLNLNDFNIFCKLGTYRFLSTVITLQKMDFTAGNGAMHEIPENVAVSSFVRIRCLSLEDLLHL